MCTRKQSSSQNSERKNKKSDSNLSFLLSLLEAYNIANTVDLMKFTNKF